MRRKPQIFAGNRRKPQIFAETGFSHLLSPFWRAPKWGGGQRGAISVVDMVFLVFIRFLYPPPAWNVFFEARKVPQKIFFQWWLCTLFSSLQTGHFIMRTSGPLNRLNATLSLGAKIITELASIYFLGYVLCCVVTKHTMWALDYIT